MGLQCMEVRRLKLLLSLVLGRQLSTLNLIPNKKLMSTLMPCAKRKLVKIKCQGRTRKRAIWITKEGILENKVANDEGNQHFLDKYHHT